MPRPVINLNQMVREVLQHTSPLPPQADCPLQHYEMSANVGASLIKYIDDHIDAGEVYEAVYDRHLGHLRRMVLAELTESFERFLKELASVCVDFLAPYMADDRFDEFAMKRSEQIAAFVTSNSIGKALCESDTWLNNKTINERFRALLKTPFGADWEFLFPAANQQPAVEQVRAATLAIIWQIRHNLAHNVGVLTHSDAMKFRVLLKQPIQANRRLAPSSDDLRYMKRFLSETAAHSNLRAGNRLSALLGSLHSADPTIFDVQDVANQVSQRFGFAVTVNGHPGVL